jgi:hypothetical protein
LINNQYILTIVVRSIFSELKAIIDIISIGEENKKPYEDMIKLLSNQPYDANFTKQIKKLREALSQGKVMLVSEESKVAIMMEALKKA